MIIISSRNASIDEISHEMDRRGRVIEELEARIDYLTFSKYPKDRDRLIHLASELQKPHDIEYGQRLADELSDLVLALLEDDLHQKGNET